MLRIGIDLGGTKIEGLAMTPDGVERARRRIPTPQGAYDGTLHAIADLVAGLEHEVGATRPARVGVAMPGAISPATGLVKNANSTWLIDRPFDRDLAALLQRPVRFENDANCLAVSEATDGAGKGEFLVFAVILGTGVGGGIAIGGRAHTGRNAIAGEWGHNPLPWPTPDELAAAPRCYCGKIGCIETFLAGPAMAADHARVTGQPVDAATIATRAAAGHAEEAATLDRYVDRLARALATVVNLLDPGIIVLGGGVSNIAQLYAQLPARLERWCFTDRLTTQVRPAQHGDSSGVRGAAWLWPAGMSEEEER